MVVAADHKLKMLQEPTEQMQVQDQPEHHLPVLPLHMEVHRDKVVNLFLLVRIQLEQVVAFIVTDNLLNMQHKKL